MGAVELRCATQFTVLGPVGAYRGATELRLGSPQQRAVLAALLVREGAQASVGELIGAVWGWGEIPETAEQVVRTYIHRLRKLLSPDRPVSESMIVSVGDGYALDLAESSLDLTEFRRLVADADAAVGFADLGRAQRLLREALALWSGEALAGIPGGYAETQRGYLGKLRLAALESLMSAQLEVGAYTEAAAELVTVIVEHPYDELFRELYMRALYQSGRQAEALAVYQETQKLLADELGIDPGPDLQELHARILRGELPSGPAAASAGGAAWPVPTQLPPDPRGFSGRTSELTNAVRTLDRDQGRAGVAVITGMAGVGKTTFAVHLGHRLAGRYPDGQLYVDLRGFGTAEVVSSAETLYVLLEALGVPAAAIRKDLDGRAAQFRSLLAERRLLLLLDNARDAEQVRPLLPGVPTSLVLITSRDRLTSLLVTDDADLITLDLLRPEEAHSFLISKLGVRRVDAEPQAAQEILDQCGRLPLAISLVAARAITNPGATLASIAAELRDRQDLDRFEDVDGADVRSVFSWSYHALTPDAARMFRLLSLAPLPQCDLTRAASLAGLPINETRRLVAELSRANLLTEYLPGEYLVHDLIRAYAAEQAESADRTERQDAFVRGLNHTLHTGYAATKTLFPQRSRLDPIALLPGVTVRPMPDRDAARAWFIAEHAAVVTSMRQAATAGLDDYIWQLAWTLNAFMLRAGQWEELVDVAELALAAATRMDDERLMAGANLRLGMVATRMRRDDDAEDHLNRAITGFRRLGSGAEEAHALDTLGSLRLTQGRFIEARALYRQALDQISDPGGRAVLLNNLAMAYVWADDHAEAVAIGLEAIELWRSVGAQDGLADSWDTLGVAYQGLGRFEEAASCFRQAVDGFHEYGDRYGESGALINYAVGQRALGDTAEAERAVVSAVVLLRELQDPRAEDVVAEWQLPDL